MLLRFRFSNVLSFRSEQELSFVAAPLADRAAMLIPSTAAQYGVLPALGIFGANASGKTNVLKALAFMSSAVEHSYRAWDPAGGIPRQPFKLSRPALEEPSTLAVDFLLNGIRHQYGFVVDSNVVCEEWLYVYPNGKKQAWFIRKHDSPISFSSKMHGENRAIEALTRPNSLFLSTAAQNNHGALTPVYRWFSDQLDFVYADRQGLAGRTASLCSEAAVRSAISEILSQADLGILGIEALPKLKLSHRTDGPPVLFDLDDESRGTAAFVSLLGPVLDTRRQGGLIAIDELDAHLHPLLALRLIELFTSREHNKSGAQLIFTTHDTNLFKALRRDQIWFTEKKDDGASTLYPLTDFKPRRDENLQNGYLQGRYGAIPFVDPETLWRAIERPNVKP